MILGLGGGWTVGFAAVKLLPTLDFFAPGERPIDPARANTLRMLVLALFSRNQYPGRTLMGCRGAFMSTARTSG